MKWIKIVIALFLGVSGFPNTVAAEFIEGHWTTISNQLDCRFWNVYLEPEIPVTWSGACQNGTAHGQGKLVFKHKKFQLVYEGTFVKGKLQGYVESIESDGTYFKGNFTDGKPHGMGEVSTPKGERYKGEFKNGQYHGKGRFVTSRGVTYEGEYQNNRRHGRGVFFVPGDQWIRTDGNYIKGQQQGTAVVTFFNGSRFEGEFTNGKRHGNGIMTLKNEDQCTGDWRNGEFQAPGHGSKNQHPMKCDVWGIEIEFFD